MYTKLPIQINFIINCNMIKGNESAVADIVFEIQAKKEF